MSFIPKLKIKSEQEIVLIDVPNYLLSAFSSLKYQQSLPQNRGLSQAVFFAKNKKALETKAPEIINKLNPEGLLWIAYPKKSGAIQSDLIRDDGWQIMYNSEWEGVASISVDDDWSAIRFRHKSVTKSLKRLPPIEERKTEGIDYINRTVTLPEEAVKMMKPYHGLEAFFYSMSFTHKKEYVEAIVEAKKPETRQRRMEKMIEMILKLKEQKRSKSKK